VLSPGLKPQKRRFPRPLSNTPSPCFGNTGNTGTDGKFPHTSLRNQKLQETFRLSPSFPQVSGFRDQETEIGSSKIHT